MDENRSIPVAINSVAGEAGEKNMKMYISLVFILLLLNCTSIPQIKHLSLGMGKAKVERILREPDEVIMFQPEEGKTQEYWTFYSSQGKLTLYFRGNLLAGVQKEKE